MESLWCIPPSASWACSARCLVRGERRGRAPVEVHVYLRGMDQEKLM
jgi:hypothetical protein